MLLEKEIYINLDDLDYMGIISHYKWIELFERTRTELVKEIWKKMLSQKIGIVIAEVRSKYRKPARYDEKILISVVPTKIGSRSMTIHHTAKNQNDEICVEADVVAVFIDQAGKPTAIPNPLKDFLKN